MKNGPVQGAVVKGAAHRADRLADLVPVSAEAALAHPQQRLAGEHDVERVARAEAHARPFQRRQRALQRVALARVVGRARDAFSSEMLGGASHTVSKIRVQCNGT